MLFNKFLSSLSYTVIAHCAVVTLIRGKSVVSFSTIKLHLSHCLQAYFIFYKIKQLSHHIFLNKKKKKACDCLILQDNRQFRRLTKYQVFVWLTKAGP